jgi:hypothetical protein
LRAIRNRLFRTSSSDSVIIHLGESPLDVRTALARLLAYRT